MIIKTRQLKTKVKENKDIMLKLLFKDDTDYYSVSVLAQRNFALVKEIEAIRIEAKEKKIKMIK